MRRDRIASCDKANKGATRGPGGSDSLQLSRLYNSFCAAPKEAPTVVDMQQFLKSSLWSVERRPLPRLLLCFPSAAVPAPADVVSSRHCKMVRQLNFGRMIRSRRKILPLLHLLSVPFTDPLACSPLQKTPEKLLKNLQPQPCRPLYLKHRQRLLFLHLRARAAST